MKNFIEGAVKVIVVLWYTLIGSWVSWITYENLIHQYDQDYQIKLRVNIPDKCQIKATKAGGIGQTEDPNMEKRALTIECPKGYWDVKSQPVTNSDVKINTAGTSTKIK